MSFDVAGPGPVLLSLPAWTPGAYELTWFARWVANFTPTAGDRSLAWDKLDYDTWRIQPAGAKSVSVRFDYLADTLDNAMAWARPDFAVVQRHQRLPLSRGPPARFPRDGRDPDRADVARRDRHAERGAQARTYREGELPRPRGHAVLRRTDGLRQRAGRGQVVRLATYPGGRAHGPARGNAVGQHQAS